LMGRVRADCKPLANKGLFGAKRGSCGDAVDEETLVPQEGALKDLDHVQSFPVAKGVAFPPPVWAHSLRSRNHSISRRAIVP
jgi:hypothetical protein